MKPVILLFFANDLEDTSRHLRKLASEARGIEQALQPAADMCEVVITKNTTVADIRRRLAKYHNRVAIVHFAGHAESLNLMLETDSGGKEGMRVETLAAFLRNQDNLELVFLNGCSTEDQVEGLIGVGVPHVIATNQAIDDATATELAKAFYEGLGAGQNIGDAWEKSVKSAKQYVGFSPRGAWFKGAVDKVPEVGHQFPWMVKGRDGLEKPPTWNLPAACNNPLFGLPALPSDIEFPASPFQHLRRFTRAEARVFCGRGNEIRALFQKVTNPDANAASVILYYGQSGVGKSSLLDAGLLPRLEDDYQVMYLRRSRSGIDRDLLDAFTDTEQSLSERPLTERGSISEEAVVAEALALREEWRYLEEHGKPVVIVLDQVEEAWSHNSNGAAEIAHLALVLKTLFRDQTAKPRGKVILAFRKEWFPEVDAALEAERVSRSGLFLKRLSRGGISRAITLNEQAREHYGLIVDDEQLANNIATELLSDRDSPLAPTLQILLATMWDYARRRDRSAPAFTTELYSELKSQGIQMGDFLDTQLGELAEKHGSESRAGLIHAVLMQHCSKLGTAIQLTAMQREEIFGENSQRAEQVVSSCKRVFLLTDSAADSEDEDDSTRLAHDTLAPLVAQRFHDSTRLTQRAERILSLRSGVVAVESDQVNLLTRGELATLRRARPYMRQLEPGEQELVDNSLRAIRKVNWLWMAAGTTLAVIFVSLFFLARSEIDKAEVLSRARLLYNADSGTIYTMSREELKGELANRPDLSRDAVKLVSEYQPDWASDSRYRSAVINATLLNAYLGYPDIDELLKRFSESGHKDLVSFHHAFNAIRLMDDPQLNDKLASGITRFIEDQRIDPDLPGGLRNVENVSRIQMRARLAWLMIFASNPDEPNPVDPSLKALPRSWYAPSEDADPRTLLIMALADWFIDDPMFRREFQRSDLPADLVAVLCQAVTFLPDSKRNENLDRELVVALQKHLNHPKIAVRSSARAALTHLGKLEHVLRNKRFQIVTSGDDWFSIEFNTEEGIWPYLDFARVQQGEHDFWLATTETPWELFEQFLDEQRKRQRRKNVDQIHMTPLLRYSVAMARKWFEFDPADKPDQGPYSPARMVSFTDAVSCCNRLTSYYFLCCYRFRKLDDENEEVIMLSDQGFRLPTREEWVAACLGQSQDPFSFGSIDENMQHFGWTLEYSRNKFHRIASRLPNSLGFFDCYGNVGEWSWPVDDETGKFARRVGSSDRVFSEGGTYAALSATLRSEDGEHPEAEDFEVAAARKWRMGFRIAISRHPYKKPKARPRASRP